ncbi:histidine phosphotransferase [Rhodophyticola sp. CCM32]|uniref:histidine phosphotransferase family protein n=1 Tax=Rhodophyticola sp. CCM32 TaxID=2916397 RepID=UPI00107F3F43|nr:histidine phosphotransferase family protein [Rhodophyticola sp. CCM32]QBY00561.1 histidine phosphotransferase [Rhodophyticola sp. CCM32]
MEGKTEIPPQDLAALVASRLCHDLVNPLGAIGNGLELLGMTGVANGPEMALINDAVKDAHARVRFFRIAFGLAMPEQEISHREARDILDDLFGSGRLTVSWLTRATLPRAETRLAFLMLNCIENALPMGGTVSIGQDGDVLWLNAEAPRLKIEEELWQMLDHGNETVELRPATVQFILLRDAAFDDNRLPRVQIGDTEINIRL